ncbi:MAG: hypothetical protein ACK6AD_07775 [Cyanobacteriota bacterium]
MIPSVGQRWVQPIRPGIVCICATTAGQATLPRLEPRSPKACLQRAIAPWRS